MYAKVVKHNTVPLHYITYIKQIYNVDPVLSNSRQDQETGSKQRYLYL